MQGLTYAVVLKAEAALRLRGLVAICDVIMVILANRPWELGYQSSKGDSGGVAHCAGASNSGTSRILLNHAGA